MKHCFFLIIIFMTRMMMVCYAAPVDLQSIHKDIKEETRYFPASVEAIEYTYKRCLERLLDEIKEWSEIESFNSTTKDSSDTNNSDGMLEFIQHFDNLCQKEGLYFMWAMGGGLFEKLLKEYDDAPLYFINSLETLDEDGLLVNHLEGIGIQKGDKMKLLSIFEDHLTHPSFSVMDIPTLEGIAKEILQLAQKEGVDISAKEAPLNPPKALTAKDKKVLGDWSTYAKKIKAKSKSIIEDTFSSKNDRNSKELEMSNIEIIATASLPFIEFINQYLSMHICTILNYQKEIFAKKKGKISENIENELRRSFEKEMEVSPISPPLGMSKLHWKTIVRESGKPNKLYFYKKTITYQDYILQQENGFVIKQNEKIIRRIPMSIHIISYILPE